MKTKHETLGVVLVLLAISIAAGCGGPTVTEPYIQQDLEEECRTLYQ